MRVAKSGIPGAAADLGPPAAARRNGVIKVRYLTLNAFSVGGTIRTVVNQANALAARPGVDVELVSVFRRRTRPAFQIDPRVRVTVLADLRDTAAWRDPEASSLLEQPSTLVPDVESKYRQFSGLTDVRIEAFLRSLDSGVLITTRPGLNLLAARFAPERVVRVGQEHLHFHAHVPEVAAQIRQWYPRLDALSVLTDSDRREYDRLLASSGVHVAHIPNSLPTAGRPRADLDAKVVVAAGRMTRNKGFDLLVDAFADVVAEHPDWQLRIFGRGSQEPVLRKKIAKSHLYNHVFLMGLEERLEREMAKGSMLVVPSRSEGFGLVITEAMASGLPVVSFDCPSGPREIITDGRDGLLVPPQDVGGLARAIKELIVDGERRRRLAAEALRTVAAYDVEHITDRWQALLQTLIAERATDPA